MSLEELGAAVNTTATVLGYAVLLIFLGAFTWLVSTWCENWHYRIKRKRKNDREWDNVRSKWLMEQFSPPNDTIVNSDRVDTAVLEFTVDQIYNYQEEQHRDAS